MRESAFTLLCAFCDGNARNQRVIFAEFPLLLQHMSTVRKATTCAKLVLANHAANCAAVTEAHLTQLIGLMSEGSARYARQLAENGLQPSLTTPPHRPPWTV